MQYIEYSKQTELLGSYDVAVLGGGPAGVCAAVEAARCGMKTILVEAYGMLGGMATTALVGPFMTCYDRDGNRQIVHGLFDEIVERTIAKSGAIHPSEADAPSHYTSFIGPYHRHVTPFDSFALQLALDDMVTEAGVDLYLYTRFVDSICCDGKIKSVILAAPQGLVAIEAKQFIDATGNADVAAVSGVTVWKGGEDGSKAQPGTLFFEINGVEDSLYDRRPPYPVKAYLMPEKSRYKINHYRVLGVDATDAKSMTNAHMEARRQVLTAYQTLIEQPGFANAQITQVAPVLGTRESRHIVGQYRLTVKDICDGAKFDDSICVYGYGMDVHPRDEKTPGGFHGESANMYEIPYRCLVPLGCDNLLVAGKTISAESQAAGSFRVMPGCMAIGQAAGAAASIAVKTEKAPADISTTKLRELLVSHGAVVDMD